ncbi:MAG: hypothetical protein VKL42_01130 [Snowella sp.]|nr:hypothetical protein [Snowella sp.]
MNLIEFKAKLNDLNGDDELIDFYRKYILHGTPYIFIEKEHDFYDFRKRIAQKFDISFYEIYVTGSAKLGFSHHKDTIFSPESDIDIAIISEKLFNDIMEKIRIFQMELRQSKRAISEKERLMYHTFLEYTAIGWIRPDKLPISFQVRELKDDWFNFFDSLSYGKSEVGNYKVTAGIFRSYKHLEFYQINNLKRIKSTLTLKKYELTN